MEHQAEEVDVGENLWKHVLYCIDYQYIMQLRIYYSASSRCCTNHGIWEHVGKYWYVLNNSQTEIHYRKKIWNIFHFSGFLYFVECVRYLLIWFTFLQADYTFGELIHTQ